MTRISPTPVEAEALQVPCPKCKAFPGVWCTVVHTLVGWPPYPTAVLHKPRTNTRQDEKQK